MHQKQQIILALFIMVFLSMPSMGNVYAQTTVELIAEPDIQSISVGSDLKEIKITARADKENVKFIWHIEGPGSLSGDTANAEIFYYILPDTIDEASEKAVITATTDDAGEKVTGSVIFTLRKPPPMPGRIKVIVDVPDVEVYINDNIQGTAHLESPADFESVPVGQAIVRVRADGYPEKSGAVQVHSGEFSEIEFELNPQSERVDQLLKEGDAFFGQRQFASPKEKNAYENYKEVLKINPENLYARKKIREIIKICKTSGNTAYEQKNYTKSKMFYQECLSVTQYVQNVLGDQNAGPDIREIENSLKELENITRSASDLLKAGDMYFEQQQFTTPKEKNAFNMYKRVLQTDPENRHAREKIYEMMKKYQAYGKYSDKQREYAKAKIFYQRYILLANYVLDVLGDQDTAPGIREAEKQLKGLKRVTRSVDNLLKKGDQYFRQEQFTSLKEANAFDFYKNALKTDPKNRHARKKIREMMELCKTRGNQADNQKNHEAAKGLYQEYLSIAEYAVNIPGIQPDDVEIWEIQNRLKDVQRLVIVSRLEPVEEKLSRNLEEYGKLRETENQGANITSQIVPVLGDIVGDLKKIEQLYEQFPQKDSAMSQKIDRVRNTRRTLEKEVAERTDN